MLGSSIKQGVKEITLLAGYLVVPSFVPLRLIPIGLSCELDLLFYRLGLAGLVQEIHKVIGGGLVVLTGIQKGILFTCFFGHTKRLSH